MAINRVVTGNNLNPYLRYPEVPPLPDGASEELKLWHRDFSVFYEELRRLLQRDREDILAKIETLS